MLRWIAGLVLAATAAVYAQVPAASGVEARFYSGFAEISEVLAVPQSQFRWTPGQMLFASLLPGTVRLSGTDLHMTQEVFASSPDPLSAYAGQEISVWQDGAWQPIKVVDPARGIFEYQGRYIQGAPGRLGYPDQAGFTGPSVRFSYQGGGASILHYVTRALSFDLSYELEVGSGLLVSNAQIKNDLGYNFTVQHSVFVAGRVPLLERPTSAEPLAPGVRALGTAPFSAASPAGYLGEAGGTYQYSYAGKLELYPGLNLVPFMREPVKTAFLWRYQGPFVNGPRLNFTRGYTFVAPSNLAAGVVTVRDHGVLVGQSKLGDTAAGDQLRLMLGPDPAGVAQRSIIVLKENANERIYRVNTVVENPKTYPVRLELSEIFSAREVQVVFPGARIVPGGYTLALTLSPGSEQTLSYTVTLKYK